MIGTKELKLLKMHHERCMLKYHKKAFLYLLNKLYKYVKYTISPTLPSLSNVKHIYLFYIKSHFL